MITSEIENNNKAFSLKNKQTQIAINFMITNWIDTNAIKYTNKKISLNIFINTCCYTLLIDVFDRKILCLTKNWNGSLLLSILTYHYEIFHKTI